MRFVNLCVWGFLSCWRHWWVILIVNIKSRWYFSCIVFGLDGCLILINSRYDRLRSLFVWYHFIVNDTLFVWVQNLNRWRLNERALLLICNLVLLHYFLDNFFHFRSWCFHSDRVLNWFNLLDRKRTWCWCLWVFTDFNDHWNVSLGITLKFWFNNWFRLNCFSNYLLLLLLWDLRHFQPWFEHDL